MNPEQWLSLKWNGGSTMSDRWLNQSKIIQLIVAPITGIIVLMCFHLWDKPEWMEKSFLLLGKHSTNIWLIHMFFYLVLFKNFIFRLKEPALIFVGMFVLCIVISILINQIEKLIADGVKSCRF